MHSPFPDAPGAHPDYDASYFNQSPSERKDPVWKIVERTTTAGDFATAKAALAALAKLFYN